jgi:hypothetical protein
MTTCGIHGDDTSSGRCATCDAGRGLGPMHPEDPGPPDLAELAEKAVRMAAGLREHVVAERWLDAYAAADWLADLAAEARTAVHDEHTCPKADFLDDPITTYYGVGPEMVGLINCAICDEREAAR